MIYTLTYNNIHTKKLIILKRKLHCPVGRQVSQSEIITNIIIPPPPPPPPWISPC